MRTVSSAIIRALHQAGISPTEEDVADILWLAIQIAPEDLSLSAVEGNAHPELLDNDNPPTSDFPDALTEPDLKFDEPIVPKVAEPTSDEPEPPKPEAQLYPPASQRSSEESTASSGLQQSSIGILTTGASALPHKLEIARALRPLTHKSKSKTRFTLDEQASAAQIADLGEAMLVYKPKLERELSAILLIDDWSSMAVWHQTIQELQELFVQLGAFRTLRTYRLSTEENGSEVHIIARQSSLFERQINPSELIDTAGHTIVFVVTDCASPAWANTKMAKLLEILGRSQHVMILNVLPETQWDESVLSESVPVYLRPQTRLPANNQLLIESPFWYSSEQAITTAFPMVSLEPSFLQAWARTLSGDIKSEIPGYHFLEATISLTQKRPEKFTDALWQHFRTTTSPTARLLAGYLAAVPLTLPVMRLVQHTMLRDSTQAHLAELLNSFLVYLPEYSPTTHPNHLRWEFIDGTREKLLTTVLLGDVDRVFNEVSSYLDKHSDQAYGFYSYLLAADDSSEAAGSIVDADNLPFAQIAFTTLAHLGYQDLANKVARAIEQHHKDSVKAKRAVEVSTGEEFSLSSGSDAGTPTNEPDAAFQSDDLSSALLRDAPASTVSEPRSALVIGLGGIGRWAVTQLKSDLLESNDGVLPSNVRLLSFDTDGDDKNIEVGGVRLGVGAEFVHLGGDVSTLANRVQKGEYPKIAKWFEAEKWLGTLPPSSFRLETGAGQFRQFGRLAIFKDLIDGRQSVILSALAAALQEIATGGGAINVFVVGSLVGNTGSSMFIDMGMLVRQLSQSQSITLRGYCVLPGALLPHQDHAMLARTFAALRELARFMVLSDQQGLQTFNLAPYGESRWGDFRQRAYDACYLVDSSQDESRSGIDAKKSVRLSISDMIGAVLDRRSGLEYDNHFQNLATQYAEKRGQPLYSTINSYSYKVPIYHLRQIFAHAFSKRFLETLLGLRTSQNKDVTTLSTSNAELWYESGRQFANEVFTRQSIEGKQRDIGYSNLFLDKLGQIANLGGINNTTLLQSHVDAFRSQTDPNSWIPAFADLGRDPKAFKLKSEVDEVINFSLADMIDAKPQKTGGGLFGRGRETPKEVAARIQLQVYEYMRDYYGVSDPNSLGSTGKFGHALDWVGEYQIDSFRRLIRDWVLRILMGESETDFVKARGGKLGFATAFMDGMIQQLDDVAMFLHRVSEMVRHYSRSTYNNTVAARAEMIDAVDRKILGLTQPDTYYSIESYLQAVQSEAYLRRESITQQVVTDTIRLMMQYASLVKEELEHWARLLYDDPFSGLYRTIERDLHSIYATLNQEQTSQKSQELLLLDKEPSLSEESLQALMRGVTWSTEPDANSFRLSLELRPNKAETFAFQQLQSGDVFSAKQKNLRGMLDIAMAYYPLNQDAPQDIATVLQTQIPEVDRLVEALERKCNTAQNRVLSSQRDGKVTHSSFIQVSIGKDENSRNYFRRLEQRLQERYRTRSRRSDSTPQVKVMDSANKYKLTMVCMESLTSFQDTESWQLCFQAYERATNGPSQNAAEYHVYAPEIRANYYEQRLKEIRSGYRVFHPRVVNLLDAEDRLKQFFLGWAFGFFKRSGDSVDGTAWELALPGSRPVQLTKRWHQEPEDFIFVLLNRYVLQEQDPSSSFAAIDYAQVEDAIKQARASLGAQGILEKIRFQLLDRTGLMPLLQELSKFDGRSYGYIEFMDLRDLGRIIYHDELRELGFSLLDVERGGV